MDDKKREQIIGAVKKFVKYGSSGMYVSEADLAKVIVALDEGRSELKSALSDERATTRQLKAQLAEARDRALEEAAVEAGGLAQDAFDLSYRDAFKEMEKAIRALKSKPAPVPTPSEPEASCHNCGRPYGDEGGFPDLVIPHDDWAKISPTGDEGGLLCPSCMCERAHEAGLSTQATFRSGPFCAPREPAYADDIWIPWKYGDPVPEGRVRVKKAQGVCWPDYDNGWNWGPISSITAYLPEALEYDLEAMDYDPYWERLGARFAFSKTPEGHDYWNDKCRNGFTPETEWKLNEMKRQWEARNMSEAPDHMTPTDLVGDDSASYLRKRISDLQLELTQERADVQDEEMQTSYWKRRAEKAEDALRTVHGVIKRTDLV